MADRETLSRYLRKVTGELRDAQRRLETLESEVEPVAVVGMSCRFPGGVESPRDLWRLVAEGGDAIAGFPGDRGWDHARLLDPDPDRPGASYASEGGFLCGATEFDAEFFGIAPREALASDPQQRLLLEAAWEALEGAAVVPAALRGTRVGVFAGISAQDYRPAEEGDGELEGYRATGGSGGVLSGRVAYALGLEGPALTIDTACSSSLVAVHLASRALAEGDCSLALAGGVTVLATPAPFVRLSRQRGLAPDGRCKAFAESADGTGFSEGVGVLVLERLSDAEANGHRVLATIRGTAVNQDGASNGLSAPSGPAQERVIRQALANAGLEPGEVDMVEGHGTGTTLGDPIEAGALLATYGQGRERPLRLGSLKSNIGHTQAAAGVGGVIKAVMAMREGLMPRTLHVDAPSSKVDWGAGEIELLTEAEPWEANGRPRRAAVSSFGISGTNAHLILEEAPAPAPVEAAEGEGRAESLKGPFPLALSAKSEQALADSAARLKAHLQANPEQSLRDTAYSLLMTRSSFEHRAVAVAESREEALGALEAIASGEESPLALGARAMSSASPVFCFPGQGSQWQGMAAQLIEGSPVFERHLEECEAALEPYLDFDLREVLLGAPQAASMERIEVVQPALFAVMVSLARLWEACGVRPAGVIGHSQGEIAAAHVAGGLSLPDAARIAALRSQLIARLAGQGAMLSVACSAEDLEERLLPFEGEIEIAAANGPSSTILSAQSDAAERFLARCEQEGLRAKEIAATIPSHSAMVEPLRAELEEALEPIAPQSSEVPFHSTVAAERIDTAKLTPEYWYANLRQPVLFEQVIAGLAKAGQAAFVEISPHPVFALPVQETLEANLSQPERAAAIGTLRREEGSARRFCLSLAQAHAAGVEVQWPSFFEGSEAKQAPLPTYPFQRKRYWLSQGAGSADPSAIGLQGADHPLLGAALEDPSSEGLTLTGAISLATHPWLADHAVAGTAVFPGAAFLEIALHAAERLGCEQVAELTLQAPLLLPESGAVQIQVSVSAPQEDGERQLKVFSRPSAPEGEQGAWALNAEGLLSERAPAAPEPLGDWPPEGAEPLAADSFYELLAEAGYEYGPAFQGLSKAWKRGEELFAEVCLAEEQAAEAGRYGIHPALLDAALHAGLLDRLRSGEAALELALPFAWQGVRLAASGAAQLRVSLEPDGEGVVISAADVAGRPVVDVASFIARPVAAEELQRVSVGDGLLAVRWRERELAGGDESLRAQVWRGAPSGSPDPASAKEATAAALEAIQAFLARDGASSEERLAILTEGAVAATEDESPDPAQAAVWGLARSAQSEHPGRFLLIDTDGSDASEAALGVALAQDEEPQLALREGVALAPRATRLAQKREGARLDPGKTVLITGATGTLGGLLARHLVEEHDIRHLLLASRSGENAPGAAELRAVLSERGAEATIVACDAADPGQLKTLLDSVDPEHPLGAVFHAAAALDDATVEALGPQHLEPVFAPKADAAWSLHQLTRDVTLTHFVLFSSAAGTLGGPGQGNYAAANAYLDALAQARRAEGLPATSIAWGYWQTQSALTEKLTVADLERMRRGGVAPLADEQGLALLDLALASSRPSLLGVAVDRAGLRQAASFGVLAPLLGDLIRVPRRRAQDGGSLARELAALPEDEHRARVLEVVRSEAAAVLGHESAADVDPSRAFQELGFDSLAALELRNRLAAAAGLRLAPTIVFDHPCAEALAAHLLAELSASGGALVAVRARAADEPIAIVGMSCRLPGGVSSPAELWQLLAEGRDAIGPFPEDRGWDLERIYDPDPESIGTSYTRHGGFLEGATEFDSRFFSVSPREAAEIDPQQRLMLEAAWEALEDAGIDPTSLRGEPAGVFTGAMYQDYGAPELGRAPGMSTSVIAGRVAYTLGLEGPAMTVDTACSSSLVALHVASHALREGECRLALAGGISLVATPSVFAVFSAQRGLAPDGRCKPFAEAADGTGFSEGIGMLVLERLSDAQANGHKVLATIRGSAINQDGASNGFSAPSGPAQERVIRQALANAGLEPGEVDMVEAHGTGTTLGDPIEAGALLATYGQEREAPLRLGSLKSNVGHTQAAAGVAGVIKAVLAMRAGVMPRMLHVDAPSSKVDWDSGRIELLTEAEPWEVDGRPRRAAVSSFGASGTNAHLILEQGLPPADSRAPQGEGGARPLPGAIPLALSAKTDGALRESAGRLASHLRKRPDQGLLDTAYSLLTTRTAFERRAVAVGATREELLEALDAVAAGGEAPGVATGRAASSAPPIFVFAGQGAQHPRMAVELIEASPVFAEAIMECEAALEPHVEWSLTGVLGEAEGAWMERLDIVQPALFAVMVSLARLWEACGVRPAGVVGHSQGEVAAAHVAGALSLDDAARVIALRSRAMTRIAGRGAMASVSLPAEELEEILVPYGDRISLAAVNGPRSQAVSGEPEAIEELLGACQEREIRARRIAVDYAAHSAQIEGLERELLEAFAPISPRSGEVPLFSTLRGERIDTAAMDAEYWYRNLRETVLFNPVVEALLEQGRSHFVEISPHPVLSFGIAEAIEAAGSGAHAIATLRRDEEAPRRFCLALAEAHATGATVDWAAYFAGSGAGRAPLPTYPFQRERHWLSQASASSDPGVLGLSAAGHPLLGAAVEDPSGEGLVLTGRVSLATHPWLADHAVAGTVILPGTAFLELALHAAERLGAEQVAELTLRAPLVLSGEQAIRIQLTAGAADEQGAIPVRIHSRPDGGESGELAEVEWTLHAEGLLSGAAAPQARALGGAWPPDGAERLETDFLYDRLAEAGFEYGPAFQGLSGAWRAGEELFAEVSLAEEQAAEADRYGLHPALLDAALHATLVEGLADGEAAGLQLPFSWQGVRVEASGAAALRVALKMEGEGVCLALADAEGEPLGCVASLIARPVSSEQLHGAGKGDDGLLAVEWREPAPPGVSGAPAAETWRQAPGEACDPDAGREAAIAAHGALRRWLEREDRAPGERLAIVTEGAVAASEDEVPDPVGAAIWGLVRSAQSEHPGSFLLVDVDGSEAAEAALPAVLSQTVEPQVALRGARALVPRVVRLPRGDAGEATVDAERTVLVTGATGTLGGLLARHLVTARGARHLLLASRSGEAAEGAAELSADLEGLGAEVRIAACDVSDAEELRALLDSVPAEHPLGAVFHTAGALDDATIESLSAERFDTVFAPKAGAAWALHELTEGLDLSHFVLFSSAAGTLGAPGQGNYAAANAFVDALSRLRRAEGLPAASIAWGYWETTSALTGKLTDADLERMRRSGIAPLSDERGLALLDGALAAPRADVIGIGLDASGLREMASDGMLPPLLSALVRVPKRRAQAGPSLSAKLAELPEAERAGHVLDLVRVEAASVLGHDSAAEVPPNRAFQELGFDSLAALELRNRLSGLSGARLEPTVVFDHPDPERLAAHLLALTGPEGDAAGGGVEADLARLESSLGALAAEDPDRGRLAAHLRALAADLEGAGAAGERFVDREGLAQASDEELLEFIDEQVGGGALRG